MSSFLQQAVNAIQNERYDIARPLLEQVLASEPRNETALMALSRSCSELGDVDSAIDCITKLIDGSPNPLAFIDQLAGYCLRNRRLNVALDAYRHFLEEHPESALASYNYAWYLTRAGRYYEALEHYSRALDLGIDQPEEVLLNMAKIHSEYLRDDGEAERHLERALELKPNYSAAHFNLGNLSEQQGKRDLARKFFTRCLDFNPRNPSAMARLADTHDFATSNDDLLMRMRRVARKSRDPDIHFAMGRALEQRHQYEDALRHFRFANEEDRQAYPDYDPEKTRRIFDQIIETFDTDWMVKHQMENQFAPVFICGMFRSGSTLAEQILAAHPAFSPAGEREFFHRLVLEHLPGYPEVVEDLTVDRLQTWAETYADESRRVFGEATRITDKRPDNFLFLGLIKTMFPHAKVVITRRDWRDIAWSIYTTRLGAGQNYATDLQYITHYIEQHDRLVSHWSSLFGADLHMLDYESLIHDPDETIASLLATLGEDWDDRCLQFNELDNTVQTASVWQVRQPLYTSSIGRWHPYETLIPEVFGNQQTD